MASDWRTSSYSGDNGGDCVEGATDDVARLAVPVRGSVLVRDTEDRAGVVLHVSAETWRRFTATLR
jgi:hypothetical protein